MELFSTDIWITVGVVVFIVVIVIIIARDLRIRAKNRDNQKEDKPPIKERNSKEPNPTGLQSRNGIYIKDKNIKGKLRAIVLGILALVPLFFTILMISSWPPTHFQENLNIINNGGRATGTIISKKDSSDSEGFASTFLEYTFTPASGQKQNGYYYYGWDDLSNLRVGGHLEIAYNPQNPSVNLPIIGKDGEVTLRGFGWVFSIVMTVLFGGLTLFIGRFAWEAWKFK